MMDRRILALAVLLAQPAGAECRLCAPGAKEPTADPARPINIEIDTILDFSRIAYARGGGSVAIDARSGARSISGGLIGLGGVALKGVVRVTGDPGRRVRISLPSSVTLSSPDGTTAEVTDLRTDLSADPILDARGQLSFAFGGRLVVSGGASGDLRGRIAITADYQ